MSGQEKNHKSPVEAVKKVWQSRRSVLTVAPVALIVPPVNQNPGVSQKLKHLDSIYH